MTEHAETGNEGQPRHRIEHGAPNAVSRIIGREIGAVLVGKIGDLFRDTDVVAVQLIEVGSRQHHGPGFDPNRQIGCRNTAVGVVGYAFGIDEFENRGEVRKSLTMRSKRPSPRGTATAPRSMGAIWRAVASLAGSFAGFNALRPFRAT